MHYILFFLLVVHNSTEIATNVVKTVFDKRDADFSCDLNVKTHMFRKKVDMKNLIKKLKCCRFAPKRT